MSSMNDREFLFAQNHDSGIGKCKIRKGRVSLFQAFLILGFP